MRQFVMSLVLGGLIAACGSADDDLVQSPTGATQTNSVAMVADSPIRLTYGSAPQQFADLTLPAGADGPAPVVVLIHGGFWRNQYDLSLMDPLAADLAGRGFAVWNLEYRRVGDDGGSWPGTLLDVADGIDALVVAATEHPLDLDRVAVVGHSAGGHLALWAAGRAALPAVAPGSNPTVTPVIAIGQGAVVDLTSGARSGLGNGAVLDFLGGTPDEFPDRYEWATPSLGAGPEMVSVVGTLDDIVPPPFSTDPTQPAGVELVAIDGADHFAHIDVSSAAWRAVVDRLDATVGLRSARG